MPKYRVFYLRDDLSQRFREMPATSARRQLKPKDYVSSGEIEAANEYAAWQALQTASGHRPFTVGDALEPEGGMPRLCQFGGFEDATWWTPEAAPAATNPQDSEQPQSD